MYLWNMQGIFESHFKYKYIRFEQSLTNRDVSFCSTHSLPVGCIEGYI